MVVVRSILGGDKGAELVLSCGSFKDDCDVNIEGVRSGECDPLGVS